MFEIAVEPSGPAYQALISLALEDCATGAFITRPNLGRSATAAQLLDDLSPWILEETSVTEWPGTRLVDDVATLHRFETVPDIEPLLRRVDRLYGWLQPDYPEDLSFYNADGAVWLGSCAHEGFAYLEATQRSQQQLATLMPGVYLRRRSRRGGA
jgi:hypothetical protein